MNDSSVSAHLRTLYRFFLTHDPEYHAIETNIHVQLTRLVYRTFSIISCLISLFANKSLANIAVILTTGMVIQLVMTEKTITLMKIFSLIGVCGVSVFRFFLVGPETALYNLFVCLVAPFIILTWTNSIPFTGLVFIFSVGSTRAIINFLDQENEKSLILLENSFIYFKHNSQLCHALVFMLLFLLVCQKQTLLAHLWARQKEKDELLREIQIKNKELEELNKSKTRLLLGLSHEFRNPINAALGNLELADEKTTDPAVHKYLSNCKASIELIFHLVSNLLDSTKMEAGILEQNLLYKKSNVIFDKVWGVAKNTLDKKNLVGEFYVHREVPQMLNIDSHFVVKIMLNLILNAAKYTQEGGVMTVVTWIDSKEFSENLLQPSEKFYAKFLDNFIRKKKSVRKNIPIPLLNLQNLKLHNDNQPNNQSEVASEKSACSQHLSVENRPIHSPSLQSIESFQRAAQTFEKFSNHQETKNLNTSRSFSSRPRIQVKKKGFLKIEIYDSGCGMDPHIIQDVIFQKFSSLSLETGDRLGLGLGLWLTKNLCEVMNGYLRAFSEKDKGSQFIVVIPMESPDYMNLEDQRLYDQSPLTALVVDDDKFNREIDTTFLTRVGVTVKAEAADGQEAVDIFMSSPPYYFDIIVLDLEMPVMGGKEACKRIREFERQQNRAPVKIIVATGNCDMAEYTECMKIDGDIRADLFYRKPLLHKDVEEMVEILKKQKAEQETCLMVGISYEAANLLKNFLRSNQMQEVAVDTVEEALIILKNYHMNVKWVMVSLSTRVQDMKNVMNMITSLSMQEKGIELVVFNETQATNKIAFCRDMGINKFLTLPFSNLDLAEIFYTYD